jgi:putative SOS response-associated peptidase YedK
MCARYTLSKNQEQVLKTFAVKLFAEFTLTYNLASSQEGLVITADEPDVAHIMHFCLVPY